MTQEQINKGEFDVTYEFTGRMTSDGVKAAQAAAGLACVSDVREIEDGGWYVALTRDLAERTAAQLGDGWDRRSVEAVLENCSFSIVEK